MAEPHRPPERVDDEHAEDHDRRGEHQHAAVGRSRQRDSVDRGDATARHVGHGRPCRATPDAASWPAVRAVTPTGPAGRTASNAARRWIPSRPGRADPDLDAIAADLAAVESALARLDDGTLLDRRRVAADPAAEP